MSDRNEHQPDAVARGAEADLDQLFALARGQASQPLPAALMQSLRADATTAQPRPAPRRIAKPSALALFWDGLQEIFGGKQGVAGAVFASTLAFVFGISAPDTATGLIGLTGTVELAALQLDTDPAVLWVEE